MMLKTIIARFARKDETLSVAEYSVLCVLTDIADPDGTIPERYTPSQETLAKWAKISVRTLRTVVGSLVGKGYLRIKRPTPAELAQHKRMRYELCEPQRASPDAPPRPATAAPRPTGSERATRPATVAGLNTQGEKHQNPPTPQSVPAAAPAARLRRREGAKQPEPQATPADAVLAKLHPQLEHEHVGRWVRARWRTRVTQALADGWQEADLIRELSKDIGNARSVAGVIDFRLKNLAAPPKPTWTPPPYVPEPVPMVHEQAKHAVIAEARATLAAARERRLAAVC